MFVTRDTISGSSITTPAAADTFCNSEAEMSGLGGGFVAWVSFASGTLASARLGSSRGWRRVDGEPFADTVADIIDGKHYSPPRIDQFGNEGYHQLTYVLTGTTTDGGPSGFDCMASPEVTIGYNDADAPLWSTGSPLACSTQMQLYCFGTGRMDPLVVPTKAPLAFVSTPVTPGGGAAAFDSVCQGDATQASLNGTFKAAVALTTSTAMERVGGAAPKDWYRVDGTHVADNSSADLLAPLDLEADGDRVGTNPTDDVWFGASALNQDATSMDTNCLDWTSASGTDLTSTGDPHRSARGAFAGKSGTLQCSNMRRVYCFQVD
jgi:hypothetical protein